MLSTIITVSMIRPQNRGIVSRAIETVESKREIQRCQVHAQNVSYCHQLGHLVANCVTGFSTQFAINRKVTMRTIYTNKIGLDSTPKQTHDSSCIEDIGEKGRDSAMPSTRTKRC